MRRDLALVAGEPGLELGEQAAVVEAAAQRVAGGDARVHERAQPARDGSGSFPS